MTTLRYRQRCLFEPLFPENLPSLYEPWMRHADRLLEDDELLAIEPHASGQAAPRFFPVWRGDSGRFESRESPFRAR